MSVIILQSPYHLFGAVDPSPGKQSTVYKTNDIGDHLAFLNLLSIYTGEKMGKWWLFLAFGGSHKTQTSKV